MHTWLPDAHSEAPTPVSALLSGSLLAVSFYAILRFYQVAAAALGRRFPRDVLLVFGVASLLLAALYLLDQQDYKRLLAYSSVEHMGILAIGVSFGAPIALAGVLLHVLAHAAAKGNAFMGAGRAGPQVRHQADRVGHRRPGRAAVERAAVPRGRARAVRDAAVRHLPQRVRDRRRRARRRANTAAVVLVVGVTSRSSGWPWPRTGCCLHPARREPPGRTERPTRRRAERVDGRPGGGRAWSRCWCSACIRRAELTGLLARAVTAACGGRHEGGPACRWPDRARAWSARAVPSPCGTS